MSDDDRRCTSCGDLLDEEDGEWACINGSCRKFGEPVDVDLSDQEERTREAVSDPEQRDLEGNPTGQTTFNVEEDDV